MADPDVPERRVELEPNAATEACTGHAISSSSARRTSTSGTSTPHRGCPTASRRTSRGDPRLRLLVAREGGPGGVAVDADWLGREHLLHRPHLVGETGEAERGEQAERDGTTVGQRVAGGGLERVGKGVPEVQLRPRAAIVRVGEADRLT